jgi:hypothetical protein
VNFWCEFFFSQVCTTEKINLSVFSKFCFSNRFRCPATTTIYEQALRHHREANLQPENDESQADKIKSDFKNDGAKFVLLTKTNAGRGAI